MALAQLVVFRPLFFLLSVWAPCYLEETTIYFMGDLGALEGQDFFHGHAEWVKSRVFDL